MRTMTGRPESSVGCNSGGVGVRKREDYKLRWETSSGSDAYSGSHEGGRCETKPRGRSQMGRRVC